MTKVDYVLKTDEKGREALAMQQDMQGADSLAHVRKSGLQQGMIVWDVGCGSGEMTGHLAEIVGPAGKVVAIDRSKEQLEAARRKVADAGHTNVSFVEGDFLAKTDLPKESVDFIFTRYIFVHLRDVQKALTKIKGMLKPGGVISVQEASWRKSCCTPVIDTFEHMRDKFLEYLEKQGMEVYRGEYGQIPYRNRL